MAEREIKIEIKPDGTVSASISGMKGPKCQEFARRIVEMLGREISFTPTAEFYEAEEIESEIQAEESYKK